MENKIKEKLDSKIFYTFFFFFFEFVFDKSHLMFSSCVQRGLRVKSSKI
jgi:hypothetical protein